MMWLNMPVGVLTAVGSRPISSAKEAEYEFGQKESDTAGIGFPFAHVIGDEAKDLRRFLRDLLGVAAGVEAFRRVEYGFEPGSDFGIADNFGVVEAIDVFLSIREIGVDFPMIDVGDDQKRRVVQVFTVLQQLLVGGV